MSLLAQMGHFIVEIKPRGLMLTSLLVVFICLSLFLAVVVWYLRKLLNEHRFELKKTQGDLLVEKTERSRAEAELQALRESIGSERQLLELASTQLRDTFKSLAADALSGNTQQFLELAKAQLALESGKAKGDLEKRQQSINELLKPLTENIEKYRQHIDEIERDRQLTYQVLEGEIKRVAESSLQLSKETSKLKDALKRPHVRGRWGELQLKNCVELAGMSEHADVTFQDVNTDADGQILIPDMIVRMPGGRIVVVDSKTPADAFYSSLEATTDEARNLEMQRHGRHVKEHVRKLSTRAYAESLKDSADFTVMFLPNESFLYAALECEPDLVEFALQRKVLIATPPTLIGLLKVIRFGWNEARMAENAKLISDAGQELHKRLCDFVDAFMDMGKYLDKAKEEYEVGKMRLERRVLVQARRLEDLGVKGSKSLPEGAGLNVENDSSL